MNSLLLLCLLNSSFERVGCSHTHNYGRKSIVVPLRHPVMERRTACRNSRFPGRLRTSLLPRSCSGQTSGYFSNAFRRLSAPVNEVPSTRWPEASIEIQNPPSSSAQRHQNSKRGRWDPQPMTALHGSFVRLNHTPHRPATAATPWALTFSGNGGTFGGGAGRWLPSDFEDPGATWNREVIGCEVTVRNSGRAVRVGCFEDSTTEVAAVNIRNHSFASRLFANVVCVQQLEDVAISRTIFSKNSSVSR